MVNERLGRGIEEWLPQHFLMKNKIHGLWFIFFASLLSDTHGTVKWFPFFEKFFVLRNGPQKRFIAARILWKSCHAAKARDE